MILFITFYKIHNRAKKFINYNVLNCPENFFIKNNIKRLFYIKEIFIFKTLKIIYKISVILSIK